MEKRRFTWGDFRISGRHTLVPRWYSFSQPLYLPLGQRTETSSGGERGIKIQSIPKGCILYDSFYIFLKKKEGTWEHLSERGILGASRESC